MFSSATRTITMALLIICAVSSLWLPVIAFAVDDVGTPLKTATDSWAKGDLGKWLATIALLIGIVGLIFGQRMGVLIRGIFAAIGLGGIIGLVTFLFGLGGQIFP